MTDIERALIVAAHPDDIDFSSGGTIATWTDAGITVAYCIATDGDAGGFDPAVPRSEIPGIRRDEQRKAGAVLGVTDIEFLGHPDGRLTPSLELRRDISRVIRRVRPDRVVLPSPFRDLGSMYGSHPDHTATGEAAMCAVYPDARNPWAHPELAEAGFEAHAVGEVWVVSADDKAEHYVDITDTFDRKVAALREHVSQTEHMTDLAEMLGKWSGHQARAAGWEQGRLAEGYLTLDTR